MKTAHFGEYSDCAHALKLDERFNRIADAMNLTGQLLRILDIEDDFARNGSFPYPSVNRFLQAKLFQMAVIDAYAAVHKLPQSVNIPDPSYWRDLRNQFCHADLEIARFTGEEEVIKLRPHQSAFWDSLYRPKGDEFKLHLDHSVTHIHGTQKTAHTYCMVAPSAWADGNRRYLAPTNRSIVPDRQQLGLLRSFLEGLTFPMWEWDRKHFDSGEHDTQCQKFRPDDHDAPDG